MTGPKPPGSSSLANQLRSAWAVLTTPLLDLYEPKTEMGRKVWAVLNRPLFGTQQQSEQVWVEGRLNRFQSVVVALIIFAALMLGGKLGIKALTQAATDRQCQPGLGGYSLGGEIFLAILATGLLVYTVFAAILLVAGWRIRKRQRNFPLGYRPWFRQRLIEGQAAVHLGTNMMAGSVIVLLLCACMWYLVVVQISRFLLVHPAEIPRCQPPHSLKAALSKPIVPIPEKP